MPCDKETVRQQLSRLMAIGVVEKVVVQQKGRHALCLYALAPDGIRMVLMWNRARAQLLGQVRAQLAMAGKAEYLDGGCEM
jgi:predicted ArsR family transcriptional regulator